MAVTATPVTDTRTSAPAAAARKSLGLGAGWWYNWVDRNRVIGIILVGVIATQIGTYFGYVFPAIGLPTLPWPLYNGVLGAPATEYGTTGSFFVGNALHYINGIVFAILYAVLALPFMPFRNTKGGNILSGLLYSFVLTIISVGVLVPYAY